MFRMDLETMARAAEKEKPKDLSNTSCPLCLVIPGGTRRSFMTHVGKHMEEIALAALPREPDSDDECNSADEHDRDSGFGPQSASADGGYRKSPCPTRNTDMDLCRAAAEGDIETLRTLVDKGADVNKTSRPGGGQTALHLAVQNSSVNVVKFLLDKGADINFQGPKETLQETALLIAASLGSDLMVKLLLNNGADTDYMDVNGRTPLSWAAEKGHKGVVKLLLKNGAEADSRDTDGRTPLSRAAEKGHEAVVKLLLGKGAEADSKDKIYDRTPLSWATENGHAEVVKLLLKKGTGANTSAAFLPSSKAKPKVHTKENTNKIAPTSLSQATERDPRLSLSSSELQMAIHQQQIALQGNHAGSTSRGRVMGRNTTSGLPAPSAGTSQARLLLDLDSLQALSYQLDTLLRDIQRRIDYVGYFLLFARRILNIYLAVAISWYFHFLHA
jgi:ankyrin repeat protein